MMNQLENSDRWLEHFKNNRSWDDVSNHFVADLEENERNIITKSIQAFQVGENSEGQHLYKFAQAYAYKYNDPKYLECIRYFIKEEQRHSLVLGKFMDMAGINRIKKIWIDDIFRGLRKYMGLEISIRVLLVAEIIALIYYEALGRATQSGTLKYLCALILNDEDGHVRFQIERIAILSRNRNIFLASIINFGFEVLFWGTVFVVGLNYRLLFKAAGYSFWRYIFICQNNSSKVLKHHSNKELIIQKVITA